MAEITLGGNKTRTLGNLPAIGSEMIDVRLVKENLENVNLSDYKGQYLILNIVPSIKTGVCSASARQFNQLASDLNNTKILTISMDLPFSQKNFCETEGIDNVELLSDFRFRDVAEKYQVLMLDSKFEGLLSRAVVIIDPEGKVIYSEQVPEIGQEPNYEAALAALA